MSIDRAQRLRRRADFDAVFEDGRAAASGPLSVRARAAESAESAEAPCRFGYAINRRVGNAVVRNRVRRRLRESARALNTSGACRGMDIVVIARPSAAEAGFQELDRTLGRLIRRVQPVQRGDL